MKVYISNYKDHWISPITMVEYMFFWTKWSKCGRNKYVIEDKDWVDMPEWADKLADRLRPISVALQWVLEKVNRRIQYVKIDRWDTWSMDHTLAHIILPMLKQLQTTKHGAPHTDDTDVPEYLRSHMAQPKENEWDTDDLHFMRWDWILNEMIWAFEQKVDDNNDAPFFDYSEANGKLPWDKDYVGPKYDKDGHLKHEERMQNGFRLFGKYYQNLWD